MIKKLLLNALFLLTSSFLIAQEAYYNDVDKTLTGIALKNALATKIIATHTKLLTYTPGVWEASKITDVSSSNSGHVVLIYGWENGSDSDTTNDRSRDKTFQDGSSSSSILWNREHVYSKSLANPKLDTNNPGPGTDAHNLRPADKNRNSTRNNFKFGDGTGNSGFSSVTYAGPNGPNTAAWFPGDEWKGDVARMMMYMYLRYGNQCLPTGVGVGSNTFTPDDMIDLFLKWNVEDPVSDIEKARNAYHENTSNTYAQGNRNPFIDNPYLATRIWGGDSAQDLWGIYTSSDNQAPTTPTNVVTNNITTSSIDVSWTASTDNVAVTGYNIYVNNILTNQTTTATSTTITNLVSNTSYAIQIEAKDLINNKSAKTTIVNASTLQDSQAPTVPTNLAISSVTDTSYKVSWTASTDNTAVTGYDVFVDGTYKASTTTDLFYTVTGLTKSTTYTTTVLAKDAANNKSAQSSGVNATTTDGTSNGITELFFSEYVEGGSNNKALEIVNLTSTTVSLAGYSIKRQANGAGGWIDPYSLDIGTVKNITPGDVFVIINGKADNAILVAQADLVVPNNGTPPYGAPVNFNGNDAVGLFKNDVLIDIIGVFNNSANYAKDKTLVRKKSITSPNTTYDVNEWNVLGKDTTSDIGKHTSTLGVDDFDYNSFKMYPNPVNGNTVFFSIDKDAKISVYNVLGKLIKTKNVSNNNNTIDISSLTNGIYLVKININNQFITRKLIKK